ncbi:MAG: hypothetical protein ACAH89_12495, partial [Rariglobus sp.]
LNVAPLRHAAWAEFHAARKRAEKSARDLHRHEETDTLAYERWLHGAFPQLVTTLRELHAEVIRKARDVDSAQFMAALTGRSVKKVWKENRADEAGPDDDERGHAPEPEPSSHSDYTRPDDDDFVPRPAATPPATADARDIYRRLVQHLHPDRGGEWTPARERLWHQVQQAWTARDADWLARLEIEWDTANDQIGPDSSLSRLRRAITELHAALRDTERKLRDYRRSPAWRFTLSEKKRPHLHRRLESELHEDLDTLQRQLAYLNATIAAWERG